MFFDSVEIFDDDCVGTFHGNSDGISEDDIVGYIVSAVICLVHRSHCWIFGV